MIILKDEAKRLGLVFGIEDFTVKDLIALVPVPAQTLRDWCKSKPELVLYLLRVPELEERLKGQDEALAQFETVKIALANSEKHNEFLTNKIKGEL